MDIKTPHGTVTRERNGAFVAYDTVGRRVGSYASYFLAAAALAPAA